MRSFLATRFSKQDKNDIPGGWPPEACNIEEMVDELRKVSSDLNKRISACIPSLNVPDADKRLKKIPEYNIVSAFSEAGTKLENSKPELSDVFEDIGKSTALVAEERRDLETSLEEVVVNHLKKLVDDELPAIQKERKQLTKCAAELKNATERLRAADHMMQTGNSGNTQAAIAKHNQMRQAFEDAEQRTYQQKDQALKALFQFDSRSRENASKMLEYLKIHAKYFHKCAEILDKQIPEIEAKIDEVMVSPVFRTPLEVHLGETKREISYVLDLCIKALNKDDALKEEGIFRTAGSKTKVDTLTHALDAMRANSLIFECEYSVVADALKQYFRFMEEPLLVSSLFDEWMTAMQQASHNERLQSLWTVCHKLPKGNIDNLRYLIKFLAKVSTYSEHNKMTPSNLGIVFGPNLLKSAKMSDAGPMGMMSTGVQSAIVELMIINADWFFPGEMFSTFTEDIPRVEQVRPMPATTSGAYVNQVAIDAAAAVMAVPVASPPSGDDSGRTITSSGGEETESSSRLKSRNSPMSFMTVDIGYDDFSSSFSPGSAGGGTMPRKPNRKAPAPPPPQARTNLAGSDDGSTSHSKSMPSVLQVAPLQATKSSENIEDADQIARVDSKSVHAKYTTTAISRQRPSTFSARNVSTNHGSKGRKLSSLRIPAAFTADLSKDRQEEAKSSTLPPPRPTSMPADNAGPTPIDSPSPNKPIRPPRPTHAPPAVPRLSLGSSGNASTGAANHGSESGARKESFTSSNLEGAPDGTDVVLDSPTEPENTYL